MDKKRVMVISDISCVGRCSLTVALPIISAGGIECNIIPTAILSTHTAGFKNYTYLDFTDQMLPIAKHWKSLDLKFDAIVTGFLGSEKQVEIVSEIIDMFKTDDTVVYVDPIMGDAGKLYPIYKPDFPMLMRKLCDKADVITPNVTEAALLCGIGVPELDSVEKALEFCEKVSELKVKNFVVTGIRCEEGKIFNFAYSDGKIRKHSHEYVDKFFHGAGDVYSSAFIVCLLMGMDVFSSDVKSFDFTYESILNTVRLGTNTIYGLDFEPSLYRLTDLVGKRE